MVLTTKRAPTLDGFYENLLKSFGDSIFRNYRKGLGPILRRRGAGDSKFSVFISYRHVEPDRRWAKWLHKELELYRVPKRLARERGLPRHIGRAFRDEEELAASSDLSTTIQDALDKSEYLIVICSPRTPESRWVNAEIQRFRNLGRQDQILALLIEGEPDNAFPPSLCEMPYVIDNVNEKPVESTREPLAADVRPLPEESRRYRKRMAKLRLLASILGCRFDELRRRDQERRVLRWQLITAASVFLVLSFAGLGLFAELKRQQATRRFEIAIEASDKLVTEVADRLRPLAGIHGNSAETVRDILNVAQAQILILETEENAPWWSVVLGRELPDVGLQRAKASSRSDVRDRKAAMLRSLAQTYGTLGETENQMNLANDARRIMQNLVGQAPDRSEWQHGLALSWLTVAEALVKLNDLAAALDAYHNSQIIIERLTTQDSLNYDWQRALASSYAGTGLVLQRSGKLTEALVWWQKFQQLSNELIKQIHNEMTNSSKLTPTKLKEQYNVLRRSSEESGTLLAGNLWSESDPFKKLDTWYAYQEAVDQISKDDPDNPQWKGDLAQIHSTIGHILWIQGSLDNAFKECTAAEGILQSLAANDPKNIEWQQKLASIYQTISNIKLSGNGDNNGGALENYFQARTLLERLHAADR